MPPYMSSGGSASRGAAEAAARPGARPGLPGDSGESIGLQPIGARVAGLSHLWLQVFLGMVGAMDRARVEAPDVVEDLFNAGIRFVHMSEEDERRTKAFGYQLGLETDWNSCICLGDTGGGGDSVPRSPAPGVVKLPRGIAAVRPHLEGVDNVPLLVSMFARCSRTDVAEMVCIY